MAHDDYDLADDPKPTATAQRVAPVMVPIPPRRREPVEDDSGTGAKKIMAFVAVAVVLTISAVVIAKLGGRARAKPAGPALADDAYIESQLDDGATDDVEKWLDKTNRRMVLGMSESQAKALAANWRHMGAKRVVAFGASVTMSLGIELPANPQQRKQLFDWENQHHHDWRKPPAKDIGQRWILVMMKP
ncbi:MAG TPA: hypothetical protein VF669_16645 [Tepidisphaeraceae bacterium]|jgi:hypothetical protein